jgi:hypothetical protein
VVYKTTTERYGIKTKDRSKYGNNSSVGKEYFVSLTYDFKTLRVLRDKSDC